MAIYDPGAGLDPFRGLELGTVFQRGKYAPVIKAGSKTQGQRLRPFQDQKEVWYRAVQYWRDLTPAEKANWTAAIPDFPTTDRYGNTVLSSARDLFLRTVGRMPADVINALPSPRPPYAGSTPADPDVQFNAGAIEFTVPPVPVGESFGYALYMTNQRPVSTNYAKPSYRRIVYSNNYPAGATIDVTAEYEALFGSIQSDVRIFWCAEIVNTNTPEILSSACGSISNQVVPFKYIADTIADWHMILSQVQSAAAYAGRCVRVNFGDRFFVNGLCDYPSIVGLAQADYVNQVNNASTGNVTNNYEGSTDNFIINQIRWLGTLIYPDNSFDPFTVFALIQHPASTRTGTFFMLRTGDVNGAAGGTRFTIDSSGNVQVRFRRNATIIINFNSAITDDLPHLLCLTYNGNLASSDFTLYIDDMSTPITPSSVSGGPMTSGAFLNRTSYPCFSTGGPDGVCFEFLINTSVLNSTDRQFVKEALLQNPRYSAVP